MLTFQFRRLSFAVLAVAVATSGCSGASSALPASTLSAPSASSTSTLPLARSSFQAATTHGFGSGWATIYFHIPVPGRSPSDEPHRVFPHYVAATTAKVLAIVRGLEQKKSSKQTFSCTAVCTGSIVAPVGPDLVTLRLEDATNELLSQGTGTVLVFKKKHNVFNFTLDGVPRFVSLSAVSNVDSGAPDVVPVTPASGGYVFFNALDADGNLITPDGDYTDAKGQALTFDVASSSPARSFRSRTTARYMSAR
jgi:hypothetical protein